MKQLTLKDVADKMLSELSGISRASENTIAAYQRDIVQFIEFCDQLNISSIQQIKERSIRLFVIRLSENDLSKNSISRKLSSLRRLFEFAIRNRLLENNPISKIPNPKIKRKLPEIINLDSFLEIYKLIDRENDPFESIKFKTIFELLYGCALRVSEMCSLKIEDIDLTNLSLRVLGKGSKVRIVPIGIKSSFVLKEYLNSLKDMNAKRWLLTDPHDRPISRFQVYNLVKKYLSKVTDISKKSPHILRHSAATHMLDNEADLLAVKEILGHENLSTTQIYTHVSIERLKKSYKKAHPKS